MSQADLLGRRNSMIHGSEEGMCLMTLGKHWRSVSEGIVRGAEVRQVVGANRVGPVGHCQDSREMGATGGL